jgi:putative salt-induced outer membrane protein YdiY
MQSLRFVALILMTAVPLSAEQVTLTNGDRLTGTVVKSDGKTLTLKTALAGTVEIQWSGIKEFVSDQPLVVTSRSSAQPTSGIVTAKDGTVTVSSSTATKSIPQTDVTALRSPSEQAAYEKSLHPNLLHGWNGGINIGFALTGGNSETTSLSLAFLAARPTPTDKISMYANTVYSANNAPGAVPGTTANSDQGGIRYDRNVTPRLFAFVNADFQADALQDLTLRSVFGGGLGLHVINNDRTTLDLLGGANYTRENYSAFTRNFAALTTGEELTQKLAASTVIKQKLYFFPDLNNIGEYRAAFDFGTVTKISKWLGWQNSFSDIYVTNPPLGKKKNDVVFTTGMNVSFTH